MTYDIVQNATELPGVDFFTRTSVGPFLDTGKSVWVLTANGKAHEHVYIALSTLKELAGVAGILSATEAEKNRAYGEGYADSLKENIGGDLRGLADTLSFVTERLDSIRSALGASDLGSRLAPEGAGATGADADSGAEDDRGSEGSGDRGDESTPLEGVDAYLDLRPAGIPSGTGNGKPLLDL